MAVGGDAAYLFDNSVNNLLKVNGEDGTLEWTYDAPTGDYTHIVYGDGAVYLLDNTNQDLLKVDADDGTLEWTYSLGVGSYIANPAFGDGAVYVYDDLRRDYFTISDAGSLVWTYDPPTFNAFTAPIYGDGAVYAWTTTNVYVLTKLDASDGSVEWTQSLPVGTHDPPVYGDDAVYLFEETDNDLYKINASDGTHVWDVCGEFWRIRPCRCCFRCCLSVGGFILTEVGCI